MPRRLALATQLDDATLARKCRQLRAIHDGLPGALSWEQMAELAACEAVAALRNLNPWLIAA